MRKLINGSMQHVSLSGERGWTASLWLVGESRMLYVCMKGSTRMLLMPPSKKNFPYPLSDLLPLTSNLSF